MSKRRAGGDDVIVGNNIRVHRLARKMSQSGLGGAIGLTFQQVQKYEKGTNRIGASRLQQIANILKVQPQFFFEELPKGRTTAHDSAPSTAYINEFVASTDGLALIKAFMAIESTAVCNRGAPPCHRGAPRSFEGLNAAASCRSPAPPGSPPPLP